FLTFDDVPSPFAPLVPPLSTVRMPLQEMGEAAVELLDQLSTGQYGGERIQTLPCEMVIRDSCLGVSSFPSGTQGGTAQ
ncbi:MAG: substrate-binding domain-containing protein, partial [Planctomycetota bacterium]